VTFLKSEIDTRFFLVSILKPFSCRAYALIKVGGNLLSFSESVPSGSLFFSFTNADPEGAKALKKYGNAFPLSCMIGYNPPPPPTPPTPPPPLTLELMFRGPVFLFIQKAFSLRLPFLDFFFWILYRVPPAGNEQIDSGHFGEAPRNFSLFFWWPPFFNCDPARFSLTMLLAPFPDHFLKTGPPFSLRQLLGEAPNQFSTAGPRLMFHSR